jgi:hypothetical protein
MNINVTFHRQNVRKVMHHRSKSTHVSISSHLRMNMLNEQYSVLAKLSTSKAQFTPNVYNFILILLSGYQDPVVSYQTSINHRMRANEHSYLFRALIHTLSRSSFKVRTVGSAAERAVRGLNLDRETLCIDLLQVYIYLVT